MNGCRLFVAAFTIYLLLPVTIIICEGIIVLQQAGNFGQIARAAIVTIAPSPVFLISLVLSVAGMYLTA